MQTDVDAGLLHRVVLTLVFALAGAAFGGVMFKYLEDAPYRLTRDDIELLKDAAAVLGPGDPIARGLWRLAERAEGK